LVGAVESPDFGHLEPVVRAALRELEDAGVTQRPETVLADAGYWHTRQMENIVSDGIQVLVPPDAGLREGARPGWDKGPYAFMRRVLSSEAGHELYKHRKATVEPVFAQTSSTVDSADSRDEADPRRTRSGGSKQQSTICSSSTPTGSKQPSADLPPSARFPGKRPSAETRSPSHLYPTATATSGAEPAWACETCLRGLRVYGVGAADRKRRNTKKEGASAFARARLGRLRPGAVSG
jgi:hypothetical protein